MIAVQLVTIPITITGGTGAAREFDEKVDHNNNVKITQVNLLEQ